MNKFFKRFIIFLALVYTGQLIIIHYFPIKPPDTSIKILSNKRNNFNIAFFGDSTVEFGSVKDLNKKFTPEILQDVLGKKYRVGGLSYPGYQSEMYLSYCKYMLNENYHPKYIIIPINLRTFSIDWDLNPELQYAGEKTFLDIYNSPLFPFYTFISNLNIADSHRFYQPKYESATVYDGNTPIGTRNKYLKIPTDPYDLTMKKIITINYFAKIHQDNRKLQALVEIAKLYKNKNVNLIFYLTPIDYQTGTRYFGEKFNQRIMENTGIIKKALEIEGITVNDYTFELNADKFVWPERGNFPYINEHINYYGKLYISQKLAEVIKNSEILK